MDTSGQNGLGEDR